MVNNTLFKSINKENTLFYSLLNISVYYCNGFRISTNKVSALYRRLVYEETFKKEGVYLNLEIKQC